MGVGEKASKSKLGPTTELGKSRGIRPTLSHLLLLERPWTGEQTDLTEMGVKQLGKHRAQGKATH